MTARSWRLIHKSLEESKVRQKQALDLSDFLCSRVRGILILKFEINWLT